MSGFRAAVLCAALLIALTGAGWIIPAFAANSVVGNLLGTWATPGRCGRPLSTVSVGPLDFSGEDFFCDFKSVSRTGDTVRWRGACSFDAADKEKTTVTARLSGGMLSYRINKDGWNGPLQRCPD